MIEIANIFSIRSNHIKTAYYYYESAQKLSYDIDTRITAFKNETHEPINLLCLKCKIWELGKPRESSLSGLKYSKLSWLILKSPGRAEFPC